MKGRLELGSSEAIAAFGCIATTSAAATATNLLGAPDVVIDSVRIKFLASFDIFRADSYTSLSWSRALVISGAGNVSSFFIGYLAGHIW